MKKKLDDYTLLLVVCVFVSILWTWWGSGICATDLDQFLFVLFPVGLMLTAFFVKGFRLIEK